MAIKVASAPQSKRIVYDNFKGVDFSKDEYSVDRGRSSYCVNMISDKGGQPEKRPGWRVLTTLLGQINCIAHGTIGADSFFLIHAGNQLYKYTDDTATVLKDGISDAKSVIFFAQHENKTKGFVLTGREYLCYDGETVVDVSEIATIPLFMIAKSPEGNNGTTYQPLNLIQPAFTEAFYGTKDGKIYQMSFENLDETPVKAQVLNSEGVWVDKTEGTDFTVDRTTGKITFVTAPGESVLTGEDNVKITAYRTVEGYADRIKKCTVFNQFGVGGNNRVFVSGNPEYKAYDWHSELNDATYFPDTFYAVIGNNNTSVMGYAKLGENQLIIKEDNQQDTTIFSRSAQMSVTEVSFPVKIGITGTGAISKYSIGQLIDEPLFLARNGIYAVTSNAVTYERTLQNRSYFVDAKLTKEANLENAVAIVWDNYYMIAVNGNVYLLDSRQKSYSRENPNGFVYECFYWENVNARCWCVYQGELYFGDAAGNLCKFNTDIDGMQKYNDNGKAITAIWKTKLDNDDMPEMDKTMQKKGCVVTLKPYTRSSVSVGVRIDNGMEKIIAEDSLSLFTWYDIDFSDLSFITLEGARCISLRAKIKKYNALQFVLKNDKINQGFGILNIAKSFTVSNYHK